MVQCGACQHNNPAGARFCNACGSPLEPGDGGLLAGGYERLASSVRERLAPTVRGEHRLVTCLFADLSGSVQRTHGLTPEAAASLVNALLESMVEILAAFRGTIDRFLGDGVLAVFGVPITHENDPERAVRAALEIVNQAEHLGLQATAGINTGRVYFGPVGSSLHEELTVMGPVVNLAARLQGQAQPGQVIIGEATHTQVRGTFETQRRSFDIKGIDEPVTAYLTSRLRDLPEKVRGIRGLQSQIVGRTTELLELKSRFAAGHAAILIEGEAGIGKSRLASEFRRHVEAHNGTWLEGRSTELTQDTGYAALHNLFARAKARAESVEAEMSDDTAISLLGPGWLEENGPFLRALVEGEPGPVVAATDGPEREALTREAFRAYLQVRALTTSLVVAFDDVHWADPLTRRILADLISDPPTGPMVVLLLSRPPSPVDLAPDDSHVRMALSELSEPESRQLVGSLLEIDGLPARLESDIIARAEGNPFFVEEIIRSFIQTGVVWLDGDTWRATPEIEQVAIPESVQAIVAGRVDRLGDDTRLVAQHASVLDQTFRLDILEAMTGTTLGSYLETLVDAGLLHSPQPDPQLYSFWHALTREAVYDTLLPSQRRELHERAALAYEQIAPGEVIQLAHHYAESPNDEKAVHYLTEAARHAMNSFLNEAALEYADRGLERTTGLSVDPSSRRARLHGIRGEVHERLADHDQAQTELRTALELGPADPLLEARLTTTLGMSLRLSGDFELAYEMYDRAESLLESEPLASTPESRHALIDLGRERSFAYYFTDQRDELAAHHVALGRLVERHGTAAHRMDHLEAQALAAYQHHNFLLPEDTVRALEPILDLARDSGNPGRIAVAYFSLGFAKLWGDQHEEAARLLTEAVDRCGRVGEMTTLLRASAYHAISLRRVNRVDEAFTAAEQSLLRAERADSSYYRGHAHATLAWVAWKRGALDEAQAQVEAAGSAWGSHPLEPEEQGDLPEDFRSLGTEFAWMAVWPAVAIHHARGNHEAIPAQLNFLRSPWERPMPGDLNRAAEEARLSPAPTKVSTSLQLAERYRLL